MGYIGGMSSPLPTSTSGQTSTASPGSLPEWESALRSLEKRQTQALAALKQTHDDRLGQLEERLEAAERTASDLAGQIREMR